MFTENDLIISEKNYKRTRLVLDILRRFLKVNIKVHNHTDQFEKGDILLFNHFARFETFIPQYLIFEQTGKLCRSLAAPELFTEDAFGHYLLSIGAVPTTLPDVIHFMACEINRGYKVVIFPEGAMIKDRRVLGPKGRFRIYSREKRGYRKPHTGAAVIALYAQRLRDLFLLAHERKNRKRIVEMTSLLHAENADQALKIASEPVRIVPANITFHPIRGDENFLSKIAERLGTIKQERVEEELIIEGNILFKDTDMDIRLGAPIRVRDYLGRIDDILLKTGFTLLRDILKEKRPTPWFNRLEMIRSEILSERIMVDYMRSIYSLTTVNLSHLCAEIIYQLLERYQQKEVSRDFFMRALYLTIKKLQEAEGVFLHRSLMNPERYCSLTTCPIPDLKEFFLNASAAGLVREEEDSYVFLPSLEREYDFDKIRIKNFIRVRYNEIRPITVIQETVQEVLTHFDRLNTPDAIASMIFDDDRRSYDWDSSIFCHSRYDEINREETRIGSGSPFFLVPENGRRPKAGVLLIHGFSASPAEMRPLGDFLVENGLVVYGVRLKGHGTSPCDLDSRTALDWYHSLLPGWEVLRKLCEKIVLVGFSMGGNLGLRLAEEKGNQVAGIVTISTPLKIRNKNIVFANILNQINKVTASLPYLTGIKRFRKGDPENPHINYQNIPISAIAELKKVMDHTPDCLEEVDQPALILQGSEDPTVDPSSGEMILKAIMSKQKKLVLVDTDRHVIVLDQGSSVHEEILQFILSLL